MFFYKKPSNSDLSLNINFCQHICFYGQNGAWRHVAILIHYLCKQETPSRNQCEVARLKDQEAKKNNAWMNKHCSVNNIVPSVNTHALLETAEYYVHALLMLPQLQLRQPIYSIHFGLLWHHNAWRNVYIKTGAKEEKISKDWSPLRVISLILLSNKLNVPEPKKYILLYLCSSLWML